MALPPEGRVPHRERAGFRRRGLALTSLFILRICLVIREHEPASFDRAACRWLARYATQRRATLARLAVAVAALDLMREDPDLAHEVLERL